MKNRSDFLRLCGGFPPCVVGSVSDIATWEAVASHGAEPCCGAVEWRVDALADLSEVEALLASPCGRPLLVTLRHASEGGMREMEERERRLLALRLLPKAAALDWEIAQLAQAEELVAEAQAQGVALVASAHDFEKTPPLEMLLEKERRARELGADIVKFAFRLRRAEDLMTGVQLLRRASGPLAVMGMGPLGPMSRLLYAQLGSVLVYGYLGKTATAPGQWSARQCREALESLSPAGR